MNSKYINKQKYLLDNYYRLGLNEQQLILICLCLKEDFVFRIDYDRIKNCMNLDAEEVTKLLSNLFINNLLSVTLQKQDNEHIEVVDCTKLFENKDDEIFSTNIFSEIEREFGKSLSSKEVELISKWITNNKYSEMEILNAIGIAAVNNAKSIKYVEKVLESNKIEQTTPLYIEYDWLEND